MKRSLCVLMRTRQHNETFRIDRYFFGEQFSLCVTPWLCIVQRESRGSIDHEKQPGNDASDYQ